MFSKPDWSDHVALTNPRPSDAIISGACCTLSRKVERINQSVFFQTSFFSLCAQSLKVIAIKATSLSLKLQPEPITFQSQSKCFLLFFTLLSSSKTRKIKPGKVKLEKCLPL